MREGGLDRAARLAVREDRRHGRGSRMAGEEAQQLAGHVAGAAQHDRGDRRARARVIPPHSAGAASAAAPARSAHQRRTAGLAVGPRVDRRHPQLLLDDPRPGEVVGRRAGHRHGLDAEPLARASAPRPRPPPGRWRRARRRSSAARIARIVEDRRHTVGAQEAVPELGHDGVRPAGGEAGHQRPGRPPARWPASSRPRPRSVNRAVARAPASSMASTSRRSETPVALRPSTVRPRVAEMADQGAGGGRLAAVHARADQGDHRHRRRRRGGAAGVAAARRRSAPRSPIRSPR